jgi:hypothetical protein
MLLVWLNTWVQGIIATTFRISIGHLVELHDSTEQKDSKCAVNAKRI